MKALFSICGGLVVEVEPDGTEKRVYLRVIEGVEYEVSREPFTPPAEGDARKVVSGLSLTKAEARAVASAMMGCAAEL